MNWSRSKDFLATCGFTCIKMYLEDCSSDKKLNKVYLYVSAFSWTLDVDTLYKSQVGNTRIVFRINKKDTWNEVITLSNRGSINMETRHYILDVKVID